MNLLVLAQQPPAADKFRETATALMGVAAIAVVLVFAVAFLLGLLSLTMVLVPGITSRFGGSLRRHPLLSFGVGVVVFVVFFGLGKIGEKVHVVGAVTFIAFLFVLLLGLVSATEDIGRRLAAFSGKERSRPANLAVGWLAFAAAACVPFVGWFIVLPYVALSGIGSIAVAAVTWKSTVQGPESPAPAEVQSP